MPENDKTNQILEEMNRRKKSYADVFGSDAGKIVLDDLQKTCFVTKTTRAAGTDRKVDPLATMFNEGQRTVLLHIQNMINLDMDKIAAQIKLQQKQNNQ